VSSFDTTRRFRTSSLSVEICFTSCGTTWPDCRNSRPIEAVRVVKGLFFATVVDVVAFQFQGVVVVVPPSDISFPAIEFLFFVFSW